MFHIENVLIIETNLVKVLQRRACNLQYFSFMKDVKLCCNFKYSSSQNTLNFPAEQRFMLIIMTEFFAKIQLTVKS